QAVCRLRFVPTEADRGKSPFNSQAPNLSGRGPLRPSADALAKHRTIREILVVTNVFSALEFHYLKASQQLRRSEAGSTQFHSQRGVWTMTTVRRLKVVSGFMLLAAIVTCSHVWGDPTNDKTKGLFANATAPLAKPEKSLNEDLATTKFTNRKLVTYQT